MESIELKMNPEVRAVILAAFPSYRKHKAFVHVFGEHGHGINSYWDGGSRNEYAIVHMPTRQCKAMPTSTHPYFDIARRGLAGAESPDVTIDGRGNVTLKRLPEDFALVQAGTFSGKPAMASIFVNAANMPRLLTAPPAETPGHAAHLAELAG